MGIFRPLFVLTAFSLLVFCITCIFRCRSKSGWRSSFLQAFIVMGFLVWLLTEILSLFKAITFTGMVISWGIVVLVALILLNGIARGLEVVMKEVRQVQVRLLALPKGLLAILLFLLLVGLLLGMTAFVAAPNNWDSMTYHMARVMNWEQNQTLAFYPTSIDRQLHLGPLAEMAILNLQILSGSDRLANLVQFFAMIGCLVGVSLIARRLGGNVYAQVFSSLAALTLPMGILQSTSTQNDYVTALWLICFVSFSLCQLQAEKYSWMPVIFAGLSLGLAVVTKITVLLFGVSFGVWLVVGLIKHFSLRVWKPLAVLSFVVLLIIAPHGFRNYEIYRNPLGPMVEGDSYRYTNDVFGVRILISNLIKNSGLQLATSWDYLDSRMEGIIKSLHESMSMDINSPINTWKGTTFSVKFSDHEDAAGNPVHFLLLMISIVMILVSKEKMPGVYAICIVVGFILFSWLFKWQPWHSRLQLPLFVLAMPVVGLALSGYLWRWLSYTIVFLISVLAFHYIFQNPSRPLLGENSILVRERIVQYFTNHPEDFKKSKAISLWINEMSCNEIGLATGIDDWEYPIWVLTGAGTNDIHIEHVLVDNPSGVIKTGFIPCAIVTTYSIRDEEIIYKNETFYKISERQGAGLFLPASP